MEEIGKLKNEKSKLLEQSKSDQQTIYQYQDQFNQYKQQISTMEEDISAAKRLIYEHQEQISGY